MGLTYEPKCKVEEYSTNLSGADILGAVHRQAGLRTIPPIVEGGSWRVPYEMSKVEVAEAVEKINTLTDADYTVLETELEHLYEGSLRDIVKEWVDFLKVCGGYEAF